MKTAKGGRKHRSAVSFCCDSSFTAPRGGRDANPPADYDVNPISTRAPHTGRDPPHAYGAVYKLIFQSARPVWGATDYAQTAKGRPLFQSTRPVRGATRRRHSGRGTACYFNPRAPCGARRWAVQRSATTYTYFNPRAPCGARRHPAAAGSPRSQRFQSSRPVRGATKPR